jgi:hypothetical protein
METKTEFKDYHLYANSLFRYTNEYGTYQCTVLERIQSRKGFENGKLILRPLSDMTDEEGTHVFKIASLFDLSQCEIQINNTEDGTYMEAVSGGVVIDCINFVGDNIEMGNNDGSWNSINPVSPIISYYLSRHFDLFGLIESGAAIDATKLKDNPYGTATV